MESDASKRQRGNSIATDNGRPGPAAGKGENGSLSGSQMDGNTSHHAIDISLDTPDGYDVEGKVQDKAQGNPAPRLQQPYVSQPQEQAARTSERESPPSLEPPVTKTTLSELDVNKIVNNPKLRHDINFDPDLHFRPNLDGEKGKKKTQKANEFWDMMRQQLGDYLQCRERFEEALGNRDWSLPTTLRAIRGILETLVPQRDRASVEETFNVELLMQQFRKGVADLEKLALWLSQLLKCHCAPMRDNWVDEMVKQLSSGNREGNVDVLVAGMQNLLGVLEAMKLDVANHQIRCLRPLLIEDTVHFEQKFFMKKIAMGRVDVSGSHDWFTRACSSTSIVLSSQDQTWDFIKALVDLMLPSKASEMIPHTFLFDEERLIKLRSDMLDLINLEVCMYLYRDLNAPQRSLGYRQIGLCETPTTSFVSSPDDRPTSPSDHSALSSPTVPTVQHFDVRKSRDSAVRGHFITDYSGRQDFVPRHDDHTLDSCTASPRSSPSSVASIPSIPETYLDPSPLDLSQTFVESFARVRMSLLAILSSPTTTDKWKSLAPSVALQILRSTTTPLTHLPHFESKVAFHLSNTRSQLYEEAESRVLSLLLPVLKKLIESYIPLSSLQVFEAATAPKVRPGSTVPPPSGQKEEINEIAIRIAHIGILHWKVWAPLAYLVNPDAEVDHEMTPELSENTT